MIRQLLWRAVCRVRPSCRVPPSPEKVRMRETITESRLIRAVAEREIRRRDLLTDPLLPPRHGGPR